MGDKRYMMSITQLSQISNIKRKIVKEYIQENYPLFRISKDRIDVHMALQIVRGIRKGVAK